MKKLLIFLISILTFQNISAQNIDECRNIVKLTTESINNKSTKKLEVYLTDDFTIAGQKGDIAKFILNQVFSQLGETVKSYEEISNNKLDSGIKLKYNIEYEKTGVKEATFIFNEKNLLKELILFKTMQVQKMEGDSDVKKSTKEIIEIPFKMVGNLIAIKVLLDGKEKNFILDTGAPRVILNSKHLTEKVTGQRSISSVKGVNGNISGMRIKKVESLNFGGIQLNNEDVISMDLSHLEKELDFKFYGLIGYELIKDYDILFDYQKQIITLIDSNTFEKNREKVLSNSNIDVIPFKLTGHIPVIEVEIGVKKFNFGIDCGAESNLIDDDLFQSLRQFTSKIRTDELTGAGDEIKEVKKGNIKKLKIGNQNFKNIPTLFSDLAHLNDAYKLNLDGLMGYPVLSKKRILISFKRKELIFLN